MFYNVIDGNYYYTLNYESAPVVKCRSPQHPNFQPPHPPPPKHLSMTPDVTPAELWLTITELSNILLYITGLPVRENYHFLLSKM